MPDPTRASAARFFAERGHGAGAGRIALVPGGSSGRALVRVPLQPRPVPLDQILPDTDRYPSLTQFLPAATAEDGADGPRTPSMSRARIDEGLDLIVIAAREPIEGSLTYEQSLRDYFTDLLRAHRGDRTAIWSIDNVHLDYMSAA